MGSALSVNEKNVMEFLRGGAKNCFLIPDYQRAYEWENDEISLLFEDLREFTDLIEDMNSDETYFLGTIVSYINEKGDREIIDGQQRTITLHLLLRAIYTRLSPQKNISEDILDRLKEIRTALWQRVNKMSTEVDFDKNHIRSESIDDSHQEALKAILATGKPVTAGGNYSKNYRRLKKLYDDLYKNDRELAEAFVYYLLKETFVFSIEATSRDAALKIFSTLNNRGKPLSDLHIFRAEMYKFLPNDKNEQVTKDRQENFKRAWKHFIERAETTVGVKGEDIFAQYMYYLRAQEGDLNSTSIGVKTYFIQNKSVRLSDDKVLPTLERILNVWEVVNKRAKHINEPWARDVETLKILELLSTFPNTSWRGAIIVYYLVHGDKPDFVEYFRAFLRKFFAWYVPLYMLKPDRTQMREYILKLNVATLESSQPQFKFPRATDNEQLKQKMLPKNNFRHLILKSVAYSHFEQTTLLPNKFQSDRVFNDVDDRLGNWTLIEGQLVKQLSKRSFAQKKEIYLQSEIAMTQALIDEPDDWTPDAIAVRSNKLAESLIKLWQQWSDDYDHFTPAAV